MSIAPISCAVEVPQAPDKAFRLFTDNGALWWDDKTIGANPPVAILMEPFANGRWFERDAEGAECDWGHVIDWDPPRRVLLAWQLDGRFQFDPKLVTEVEISFEPTAAGGTRVTLEHRNLERFGEEAPRLKQMMGPGWAEILGGFDRFANAQQENA